MKDTFELKKEHLTLARNFFVSWWDCEFGAPAIDPKRPYGNSDVVKDILEILKVKPALVKYGEKIYSDEQEELAVKLHKEMETALQIILLGHVNAGTYAQTDEYDAHSWKLIK